MMFDNFENIPILRAGARLSHGPDRRGYVGVLATNAQREVIALTVSTVIAEGEFGHAPVSGGHRLLLGPAQVQADSGLVESPIAALISSLPVSHDVIVRSEFAQLETARGPVDVDDDTMLYIVRGDAVLPLGVLTATHSTIYRGKGEQRKIYYGASEVALASGSELMQGDAGAPVTCGQGRLYGLMIGSRGGVAIVAPLKPLFHAAKLTVLSPSDASRHLVSVQTKFQSMALTKLLAEEAEPKTNRVLAGNYSYQKSSDQLLQESNVLSLAA